MQHDALPKSFKDFFLRLPLLEQAGFFLWPSLEGTSLTAEEKICLKEIKPSGLIFFKRNFTSLSQAKNLIAEVKNICEKAHDPFFMPRIFCIDEEGGRVSRLPPPFVRGKSALEFAKANDPEGLCNQVLFQSFVAKGIGINCLLAPVADILTEPSNQVMGDRCFGEDPKTVLRFASLIHQTLHAQKLFSCAKHFPGHGDTKTDSHKEVSVSSASLETLKSREWIPFQHLIQEGIPFVMAAHVLVPQIDSKNPATLSSKILTGFLKNEMGFKGLILSDDLRMNAIALHHNHFKKQESSVTEEEICSPCGDDSFLKHVSVDAIWAGCDILLSCQSIVREKIIAAALAEKSLSNPAFGELLLEKAWKIYQVLTSTFSQTPASSFFSSSSQ